MTRMTNNIRTVAAVLLAVFCASCLAASETPAIDSDFPGGNITVKSFGDGIVHIASDPKGCEPCFYWSFRVVPKKAETLIFSFDGKTNVSYHGPAVSLDGGKSWKWLYQEWHKQTDHFQYKFKGDGKPVVFAFAPLYTQADFDRFIDPYLKSGSIRREVLCKSERGRDVYLYRLGAKEAKYTFVLTARHHARESSASFVLQGTLAELLSGKPDAKYLLANASFHIIPFVDCDGVELGEPGKNRAPHDHNRDYGEKRYAAVRAITAGAPEWSKDGKLLSFDYHCPGGHNSSFFVTNFKDGYMLAQLGAYTKRLVERQSGGIIPFTSQTKPSGALNPAMSRAWFASRPNTILAVCFEVPFSTVGTKTTITRKGLDELGVNIAAAMADFLRDTIDAQE